MISSKDAEALVTALDYSPEEVLTSYLIAAAKTYNTGDRTKVSWRLTDPQQR